MATWMETDCWGGWNWLTEMKKSLVPGRGVGLEIGVKVVVAVAVGVEVGVQVQVDV